MIFPTGNRPLALDLYCCAGGASKGLHDAGFDVVGVDIKFHKNYPFPMIVCDALQVHKFLDLSLFALIWASPPCQRFSVATPEAHREKHPDLIEPTRQLLKLGELEGAKTAMENVPLAPLRPDVILNGVSFGLPLERRRIFEVNFSTNELRVGPRTRPDRGAITAPAPGAKTAPALDRKIAPCGRHEVAPLRQEQIAPALEAQLGLPKAFSVAGKPGGTKGTFAEWQAAMEIDWMNSREIVEAVPPAYAEAIGRCALNEIHPSAQSASMVPSDRMGGGSPMRLCEAGRGGPSDHPNLSENQPCFSKQQLPQAREAGAELHNLNTGKNHA